MQHQTFHSDKAFRFALFAFWIPVVAFLVYTFLILFGFGYVVPVLGVAIFVSAFLANLGIVENWKERKEPFSKRKLAGIIINSVILLLFLVALIVNAIDIYRAMQAP